MRRLLLLTVLVAALAVGIVALGAAHPAAQSGTPVACASPFASPSASPMASPAVMASPAASPMASPSASPVPCKTP